MEKKREILITNDDGIDARGIAVLTEIMRKYGNITVVAPYHPQSGKSASLSLGKTMYLRKISEEPGLKTYSFEGTPVDCVKLAINEFYPDRKPDLLLSGINHGSNCSAAALYSGTLGACIEGTLNDIPSVGWSINTHDANPDFSPVTLYADTIMAKLLSKPFSKEIYLNINFPDIKGKDIKGIRMARKGRGRWIREFEKLTDRDGETCYFMKGEFEDLEEMNIFGDHIAVHSGYISIVPHTIDNTDYPEIERLREAWQLD